MARPLTRLLLALGLAAALPAAPALAQVGNYSFTASAGTFVALPAGATNVPVLRDDDATSGATLLPLGFTFAFDGVGYTGVKACSNGFLSFNPNATYNVGNVLGGSMGGTEKPLLAPLWDDLSGSGATTRASYLTTGVAPNRVFTFEWLNWKWSFQAPAAVISFQVKLYEGSNRIEYVYRPEAAAPSAGPSLGASIGLAASPVGAAPAEFLSLNNTSAAPVASATTETTTIAAMPAAGQTYAFEPAAGGCQGVRGLAAGAITATSVALSFQPTAGTTGYQLAVQPVAGGTINVVALPGTTALPYVLTGLAPGTAYTLTVNGVCGGATSAGSTITFTTATAAYCTTGLGGACGPFDMTAVVLGGSGLVARNLSCAAAPGGAAYTAYPATAPTTGRVAQGSSYPLSISTVGNSVVAAWADWNQNFAFEASEWVQVSASSTGGGTATVTLAVPAGAVPGTTALRIRTRQTGNANGAGDACTAFSSGETKDFTLTVVGPAACALPTGLAATAVGGTGATLGYTAGGGGAHTVVYGPAGFDPATGGTRVPNPANPLPVSGLMPGTAYDFYVVQACGPGNQSQAAGPVGFATAPANDDPCTAIALPLTGPCAPQPFSSLGATVTTSPAASAGACLGANINPRDVWFSVTTRASGPGSTALRFAVTGNAAARVQLFRVNPTGGNGCAGPFISVACAGGATNQAAPDLNVSTGLVPATTYYLRIHGANFNDPLGPFTLCATAPGLITGSRAAADAAGLFAYPNPSGTGSLGVRLPTGHLPATALLLNALGQTVLRHEVPADVTETVLPTRGLAAGVYSLRVNTGGEVLVRKVVLE